MTMTSRSRLCDVAAISLALIVMILAGGGLRAETTPPQGRGAHLAAFVPGVSPAKCHCPHVVADL